MVMLLVTKEQKEPPVTNYLAQKQKQIQRQKQKQKQSEKRGLFVEEEGYGSKSLI